jgi:hypothetical protein
MNRLFSIHETAEVEINEAADFYVGVLRVVGSGPRQVVEISRQGARVPNPRSAAMPK